MSYYGENLDVCFAKQFDWRRTHIIVVTGDTPCGHALLNVGGREGYYIHVAPPVISRPRYMRETGYQRYLEEHGKRELKRQYVYLSKPEEAQKRLDFFMAAHWVWMGLPSNCASFVEEVIRAGGSQVGITWHCPAREKWE
jgi:hypothetical protein